MSEALVLFSAGIDSTTALYWALATYDKVSALSFDYGQRHRIELVFSEKITRQLEISHQILKIDLRQIGGSSLTDSSLLIPSYRRKEEIGPGLPSTYVPFRNGIFIALAAAWSEVRQIREIVCGFNTIDSPHYPDTRIPFIRAMEEAVNQGTKAASGRAGLKIVAPFIRLKKSEIISKGLALGADYSYSISCYWGEEIPCQKCSSCLLRKKAWTEVGRRDHLLQRLRKEGRL